MLRTNNTHIQKKSGFTLVELSIVLVIIGLLIGGILVGKSLMETAKYNKQFAEWAQMEIAATTYKAKYKRLPGDDPKYRASGAITGNADGYIDQSQPTNFNGTEKFGFFGTLKAFDMFFKTLSLCTYNGTTCSNTFVGQHFPPFMKRKDVYYYVEAYCAYPNGPCRNDGNNYIMLGPAFSNGDTGGYDVGLNWPNYPITPYEAAIIDNKLDDGQPLTGDITAATGWATPASVGGNCVNGSSAYNTGYQSKACGLYIKARFY